MSFEVAAQALAQAGLLYAVGWVVAHRFLLPGAFGPTRVDLGLPERALAGTVGAVAFCTLVMAAHIATRGAIFESRWVVPAVAILLLVLGFSSGIRPRSVQWMNIAGAAAILVLLFVTPVLIAGSGVRTGDSPWHLGWSQQLLSGEPTPTGPAPEFSRNAYPWGLHAVIATLVRLVPGSDTLVAHEALHVLIAGTIPLAAACLARAIDRRAGWPAAGATALIGGWGWLSAEGPSFVLSPSLAKFGADLVVASPNSMYELFPPALPRELGLVLLGASGVLVAYACRSGDRRQTIGAGVVVGLAGLVSVPMMLIALGWLVPGLLTVGPDGFAGRASRAAVATAAAFATMAIWLVPVVFSYVDFGGFVDITPELGVEWPLASALWSWGLLLPLAIAGLVISIARRQAFRPGPLFAFAIVTAVLLGLAIMRGRMEWSLAGNETVLHQGRMWPAAHLLGAAFAGVALAGLLRWSARRWTIATAYVMTLCASLAVISPVFASTRLIDVLKANDKGFLYSQPDFGSDGFLRRAAEVLDSEDVIRVEGSDGLGFALFQFAGVRLAAYDDQRLADNDLRIRFADLAAEWNRQMADRGFVADYTALPASEVPPEADVRVRGHWGGAPWVLVEGDQKRV